MAFFQWPLHQLRHFCLEARCCSLNRVCLGSLLGIFIPLNGINGISSKYLDVFKLIHYPWYSIKRSNTVVWKTFPYHDRHDSLSSRCTLAWIPYPGFVWCTVDDHYTRKEQFYSSVHRMLRHFSLGQSMCSLAKFNRFCTVFSTMVLYGGFLLIA